MDERLELEIPGESEGAVFRRPTHGEWDHLRWILLVKKIAELDAVLDGAEDASVAEKAARGQASAIGAVASLGRRAMKKCVLSGRVEALDDLDDLSLLSLTSEWARFVVPGGLEGNWSALSSPRSSARRAEAADACSLGREARSSDPGPTESSPSEVAPTGAPARTSACSRRSRAKRR